MGARACSIFDKASEGEEALDLVASYAHTQRKHLANRFRLREGLIGQCAFEKRHILLTNVPQDYIQISSGLGEAPPLNILVLPILFEGEVKGVLELASFGRFSDNFTNPSSISSWRASASCSIRLPPTCARRICWHSRSG